MSAPGSEPSSSRSAIGTPQSPGSRILAAALDLVLRRIGGVTETIGGAGAARRLRGLGLEPLPSHANFLYVPIDGARETYERLLERGLVVRPFEDAIRVTVHTPEANERLLEALTGG